MWFLMRKKSRLLEREAIGATEPTIAGAEAWIMPSNQHVCGYPLIRVIPRSVHRLELMMWYDGKKGSPTYKQEVTVCPGCGESLSVISLKSTPDETKQ
jgi:hypothetical protein